MISGESVYGFETRSEVVTRGGKGGVEKKSNVSFENGGGGEQSGGRY